MTNLIPFNTNSSLLQIQQGYLEEYLELLSQCSTLAVSAYLSRKDVKGSPGDCNKCAVSMWARKYWENFGPWKFLHIETTPWEIRVHVESGANYWVRLPIPQDSALNRFIFEFDSHKFPHLER